MSKNNPVIIKTNLFQKILLILFGLSLFLLSLEIGLGISGFVLSSLQEYRNQVSLKQKGEYRIMCLGESTTAGDDSYPRQLEEILNQRGQGIKFRVINKGVGAAFTSFILAHLEENLNKYNPDMVITMIGINDYGPHMPYKDGDVSKTSLFFRSFKTYNLARLIWLHLVSKLKELHRERTFIEQTLEKAIKVNPKNYGAYSRLAWFYEGQGKYDLANKLFKKSIEAGSGNSGLNGELAWLYTVSGCIYARQEKYTLAEEMLKKAIGLNSENYWAYYYLWDLYVRQGKYTLAEEMLKKAIALNRGNDSSDLFAKQMFYKELGWFYVEQKKYAQAQDQFEKAALLTGAVKFDTYNDGSYGALAILYRENGKYEAADRYYMKSKSLENYHPSTINNYRKIKEILDRRGVKLVCVQYPMRSIEPLKKIFKGERDIIFVDNEKIFSDIFTEANYREYFIDMFAGDFGHCTYKGNRLLAENIANVILREAFNK